jgi:exopolyphosphatase
MRSLPYFLRERHEYPTQHLVIGNPAGDADSTISAISLAYVESMVSAQQTPIVSIPRADLATQRPETTLLLELAGITREEQDQLWFVDDPQMPTIARGAHVTLVDHNRLVEPCFNSCEVVAIWDHHMDEGDHSDTCESRHIEFDSSLNQALVASTGTLVVERMIALWVNHKECPADIGLILLGLVLLDSINLSGEAGKVTFRDVAAVEYLLRRTAWHNLSEETRARLGLTHDGDPPKTLLLFEVLQGAKFDPLFWSGLSVRDALRLDYKQFSSPTTTFGISTVLVPAKEFTQTNDFPQSIEEYMLEVNVDFLVVMLAFTKPDTTELQRELILCGRNEALVINAVEYLMKDEQEWLLLHPMPDVDIASSLVKMILLEQGNRKASRKQVAPVLLGYFEKACQR